MGSLTAAVSHRSTTLPSSPVSLSILSVCLSWHPAAIEHMAMRSWERVSAQLLQRVWATPLHQITDLYSHHGRSTIRHGFYGMQRSMEFSLTRNVFRIPVLKKNCQDSTRSSLVNIPSRMSAGKQLLFVR